MPKISPYYLSRLFREKDFSVLKELAANTIKDAKSGILQHPLGFYHCNLYSSEDGGTKLRLHYWRRDELGKGSAITPYHDHVWKLSSCVIHGEIYNHTLNVVADPEGDYTLETVEQKREPGRDSVGTAGLRVRFGVERIELIKRAMFYQVSPRQFHFSSLGNCDHAVSLVLSEPGVDGNPRTLMPLGAKPHAPKRETSDRAAIVGDEILAILDQENGP